MQIQNEEHGAKGAFFIEQNGEWIAEMTYKKSGARTITIDHTEVDESLQGKGVGKDLVEAGVKFARTNNLKIVAECPFAKKVIDETPEFQDVLAD
ncbi:MAG: N-acetyltransferase [Acidobacteriota bacterium]|nr:N-acetyltransferase [Acidobacteriota bacterium]